MSVALCFVVPSFMSVSGPTQTSGRIRARSVLPPTKDIRPQRQHVRSGLALRRGPRQCAHAMCLNAARSAIRLDWPEFERLACRARVGNEIGRVRRLRGPWSHTAPRSQSRPLGHKILACRKAGTQGQPAALCEHAERALLRFLVSKLSLLQADGVGFFRGDAPFGQFANCPVTPRNRAALVPVHARCKSEIGFVRSGKRTGTSAFRLQRNRPRIPIGFVQLGSFRQKLRGGFHWFQLLASWFVAFIKVSTPLAGA